MNANCAIFIFFLALLTIIYPATEVASAQDDDADLKALDELRTSSLRPSDGHLVDWYVIGPFSVGVEKAVRLTLFDAAEFTAADMVQVMGRSYSWTPVSAKNGSPVIDLTRKFGDYEKGIAFVAAEVYVNRDMNATIRVESSEKADCWINGQAVTLASADKEDNGVSTSRIRLRLGHNEVVIGLRHGRGKWSFSTRVLDEAGELIDPKRLRILDDGLGFSGTSEIRLEVDLHRP